MVLVLLGLLVFTVLTTRNLSAFVRENLTVSVVLANSVDDAEARTLCEDMSGRNYVRDVEYISKEQAQREQADAMGADPSEFLGFNPFSATLEVRLRAAYANRDSLAWISESIKADARVEDIAYQEDLMDKVNSNLSKAATALLTVALLLTCISFSLINSSVRLSVYSRRFLIHTMKLVGASWGFIRKPFMRRAAGIGLLAATIACALLAGCAYALLTYEPAVTEVATWRDMALTAVAVYVFGLVITLLCSYFSVNKFLRMSAGELYKI